MNQLIERCIAEIRQKSERDGIESYDVMAPSYPSIIVNYNLDDEKTQYYYRFLEQMWPSVYAHIPRTERESDFYEKEKDVRSDQIFENENINVIRIHVLVNMTECRIQDLSDFIKEKCLKVEYQIVLHEFLDYKDESKSETSEQNLIHAIQNFDKVHYQFVYSNRLSNGAMWIGENAAKLMRLAANITGIMSIDTHYFSDSLYTFSYNLLEKPTKQIIQFTIRKLLENICCCQNDDKCEEDLRKKYENRIQHEVNREIRRWLFEEKEFEYLPDNQKLKKEKKKIKKGMLALERNYPVAKMCFTAMLNQKIYKIRKKSDRCQVDFTDDLADPLFAYCVVDSFLNGNHEKEFLDRLKESFVRCDRIIDEGSYSKVLTAYANHEIEKAVSKSIFEDFSKQFNQKVQQVRSVYQWLQECRKNPILQAFAVVNERNLIKYYGNVVDDYFKSNQQKIIAELYTSDSKENLLQQRLYSVLKKLFDDHPVYYMPFEDEVDERVGTDTARDMFETINSDTSVERNICIKWVNLQFELEKQKTSDVVLLMHPESRLLNKEIPDNYYRWTLNEEDCVERIDFHVLKLKPKQEAENEN